MTRSNRLHQPRTLGLESLEARKLMAGDVKVALSAADTRDLIVSGDDAGNQILIEEIAAGLVRVTGLDGTRINGSTQPVTLPVKDDVVVNTNRGDDVVTIRNLNLVDYSHSDLNVNLGQGNDVVNILAVDVARHLAVAAGGGNDDVTVREGTAGDMNIRGEYGNDKVSVRMSTADSTISIDGGEDNDELEVVDTAVGDDVLLTGDAGDDRLVVRDVSAGDDIRVNGGAGHDSQLSVSYSAAEDVTIYGGTGNDSALLYHNDVSDYIYASLGSGDDDIYVSGNEAARHYFHGGTGRDHFGSFGWNWFWGFSNTYAFE